MGLSVLPDFVGIFLAPLPGTLALRLQPHQTLGLIITKIIGILLPPAAHAVQLPFFLALGLGADLLTGRIFIGCERLVAIEAVAAFHLYSLSVDKIVLSDKSGRAQRHTVFAQLRRNDAQFFRGLGNR